MSMPIGDLLDLIVCTECKTRVEYHEERDGHMSCECWIRSTADDPTPDKWIEVEDRKVNLCGGCRANIPERSVFRCADCGLPFHQTCLDQHCKHGNQKQELRSENLFLKSQLAEKDAQVCGAREAANQWVHGWGVEDFQMAVASALTSSSLCRHAKEAERWEAAWRKEQEVANLAEGQAFDASYKAAELIVENKRLREAVEWASEMVRDGYAAFSPKVFEEELRRRVTITVDDSEEGG
jgi:uncharacterized protein YbaR (Trm112 family)